MGRGIYKRTAQHKASNSEAMLKRGYKGEKIGNHVLSRSNVLSIRALHQAGWTERMISKEMRFAKTTIHDVISGRTWSHVQ